MNDQFYKRADWIANSNIYEVNIRQYSTAGSFNAFAASLPRLKDMGVEVLWFMPIHPIGKINRKGTLGSYYSIADFKAVNPEFGTAADFKNLVKLAQEMGMKVIMVLPTMQPGIMCGQLIIQNILYKMKAGILKLLTTGRM